MSLLNQASLIVVPSGYKEGTLYSAKPINGDGDLSFTRASNGSRINSEGLVEVVAWNLLQQSESFDSGTWNKTGVTVTANTTTAPNGTTTADTLVFGASSNEIVQSVDDLVVNETYTLTIYLRVASGTATMYWGNIDYTTPTITVTTEWQRFTVTQQAAATTRYPKLVSSSAVTVYAWGAQLNIGSTAKTYFPTTDRLNVPRLTYPVGGGCPSLLLEKQSTNLALWSEQFDNAGWTKYNATITANNTISPDGTQNADKYVDSTTNDTHNVYQAFSISGDNTISIYVKSAEYTRFAISNLSDGGDVLFNLSTVAIISTSANFQNGKIESVGNGWYRVSATTNGVSGSKAMGYGLVNDSGAISFAGTGSKGVYIWGAQLEASSYPTSLINTTSSSATRVADACFKTGISSLIGQTEGTIFIDMVPTDVSGQGRYMNIYNGSNTSNGWNAIISTGSTPNTFRFYGDGFDFSGGACLFGVRVKVALAYKNGVSTSAYVNGASVGTLTAVTTGKIYNTLTLGEGPFGLSGSCNVNESIIFPTALTNAELASLTTL
jgi:hypothetical protein